MSNQGSEPLTPDRRRDLRLIFAEGVAFSVMVGVGESYLAAFVLALGLGEVASGLVATIPLLAGGVIQLVTPFGVRWLRSRRRWSVLCAALQAASFIPLVAGAWAGTLPAWVVFAATAFYWAAGMAIGPAWNVWAEELVPRRVRVRYFARRTSAVQLGVLAGLLGGGAILETTSREGIPLLGFALIFGVAGGCRGLSTRLLAAQSETAPLTDVPGLAGRPLLHRSPTGGPESRLLLYLLVLTTAVSIASPYFSPYMLAHLEFSYLRYTILIGVALLSKVLALPVLSGLARRLGLVALLRLSWIGIAAIPAMWLVSGSYSYLLGLQVWAGASWATHEYVTFLLLFETIHARRRVAILTAFNLGSAVATVGGSLIGAWIFRAMGGGDGGYATLFIASSGARIVCLVLLMRIRETRAIARPAAFRLIAVRPATGAILRPIVATIQRSRRPRKARRGERTPGRES